MKNNIQFKNLGRTIRYIILTLRFIMALDNLMVFNIFKYYKKIKQKAKLIFFSFFLRNSKLILSNFLKRFWSM